MEDEKEINQKKQKNEGGDSLVYTIEQITRICRSTGPKEVLIKLAINRHILLLQISAIKIQSVIRQFLAKVRLSRIRRNVLTFERVTLACSNQIIDEVILSLSLQLVINTVKTYRQLGHFRSTIDDTLASVLNEIISDVLSTFITEIVVNVIQASSENYLILHRYGSMQNYLLAQQAFEAERLKKSNPILSTMMNTIEDSCHELLRPIVIQAIEEEVADYLLEHHATDVLTYLLDRPFFENEVMGVINSYLEEISGVHKETQILIPQLEDRRKHNLVKEVAEDTILKSKWTAVRQFLSSDHSQPVLKKLNLSQRVAELFVKNLFSSVLPER